MDFVGAVIGKAADAVGQGVNQTMQAAMDPDKAKISYEELVAPVQQEMQDTFPGLEMLMLPDQRHLVMHQKVEAAELISDMTNFGLDVVGFPVGVPNVETPNTYALRDRDTGVTYYLIQELSNGWEGFCFRDQCRRNMPMKFAVKNMRTQQVIARIESPLACDPCCCGCYWCCCIIPIPVCCCSRTAQWLELNGPVVGGEGPPLDDIYEAPASRIIAEASLGCTSSDCGCAKQINASTADGTTQFSLFKRFCCCGRGGCFSDAELSSDWNIVDEQHSWEAPLGRIWLNSWKTDYTPTSDRYPPLPEQGIGSLIKNLVKQLGKELFTDADTNLVELPFDRADEKAALVLATLVSDYYYNEEK